MPSPKIPPRPSRRLLADPEEPFTPLFVPSAGEIGVLPCAQAGIDPDEVFFPSDSGAIRSSKAVQLARAVCGPCPLQDGCRQWAQENREWGIWGGESQQDRYRSTGISPRHASLPSRRSRRVPGWDASLPRAAAGALVFQSPPHRVTR